MSADEVSDVDEARSFEMRLMERLDAIIERLDRITDEPKRDIDRILHEHGCKVTSDKVEGGISAVNTLIRIYQRSGRKTLGRVLSIILDAYGTPGLEADILDGVGYLCGRYNGDLEDQVASAKLGKLQGGVNGLRGRAAIIRERFGLTRGHAIAAAAVDVINAGRGGKKLASWFREDAA